MYLAKPMGLRQGECQPQDPRLDWYKEVHWANLGEKSTCVAVNGLNMPLYQIRTGNDKHRI